MISKERLNGRIIEVLSRELSVDSKNIGIDEKLVDLDFDSVDFIEALFALEEEFEVEFLELPPVTLKAGFQRRLDSD